MNVMTNLAAADFKRRMSEVLTRQKAAQVKIGPPSAEVRIDRINRAIALLVDHKEAWLAALNADFGSRSPDASLLTDIAGSIGPLKQARAKLKAWMRPERRAPEFPFGLLGAGAEIRFQPKGVVGIIAPWNFPLNLTFAPLAGVLAAGNRAMIKPSELTPATSELMAKLMGQAFADEEIAVFTGGPDVGGAFAGLPFDHLLFTGGTAIAYHIMRAAAENLTPVTLELGGKSPVVLGKSADMALAAARVMTGKTLNAGQICLAPDYVLAPAEQRLAFVEAAKAAVAAMFPTLKDNPDYTAIVSQRHFERLKELVADARAKGGEVIEVNPANDDFSQQEHRKIPPTLILNPTEDMRVMTEEIFGPILPIKTYGQTAEALAYINAHPRPLGLYYFGADTGEQETVLNGTISGGVTVNDVIMHVAQEDLPFGGIGPSGMGYYHGRDGFLEFSVRRAVYRQTPNEKVLSLLRPPYSDRFRQLVGDRVKK